MLFLFVSLFAFFSNLFKTIDEFRKKRIKVAGGYLAHVGLGLMLAGIITSSAFNRTEKVVLPLGEGKQVMGYTLTFKGVDKPTPTARDAMMVEVRDAGGKSLRRETADVSQREVQPTRGEPRRPRPPDPRRLCVAHRVRPGTAGRGEHHRAGQGRHCAGRAGRGHLPGVRHERVHMPAAMGSPSAPGC